ncbi:peptidoglycan glycosyltransferase FtsI [Enterobacteriaceae bacterium ML5]|nr:peptidoglycan glycosyltransferase FtsI [Enterobacteriaceae bacterium ML5]
MKNNKIKRSLKSKGNFIYWRFYSLRVMIFLSLILLTIRLGYLQIFNTERLLSEGNMRSIRTQTIPVFRGSILDRNGRPLAISVPVYAIWADPKVFLEHINDWRDEKWEALAVVLKIPKNKIYGMITANPTNRFVYLTRQTEPAIGNYISKLNLPGIYLRQESKRYYPSGEVTSQLIGITNIDGAGIDGVEKSFNHILTGQAGKRVVRRDRRGQVIENISLVDGGVAHDITLSIDERLQYLVYHKLNNAVVYNKAKSGSAVLLDINTGEILAMANYPSYNPNNLLAANKEMMRNRIITDMYEPASTVKPMVVLTALLRGVVKPDSVLNTLPYYIGDHQIRDVGCYAKLSITGVLQKSSNVGVSKMSLAMPVLALIDTYRKFGLGKPTLLGLVGESSGFLPTRKQWSDLQRATFSYGYGLMVTPLQLARVFATLGSFGIYRPLSITKVELPVQGQRVFPESVVRTVVHMMESVALPGGGGAKGAIKGYRIAIKTGTLKKVGKHGKYVNKYISYTAGLAPVSQPRFSLVIIIDEPNAGKYYGGAVSAPIFGEIMSETLRVMNIKPDALSLN